MNKSKRTYYNGQFEQRTRKFFAIEQGLPSLDTLSLAFDLKGTLFAGTAKGLARIEGDKIIPVSLTLPEDDCAVSMLFCDSLGRLWVGSKNRLFCLDGKKAVSLLEFTEPVIAMAEGENGGLWLLTEDLLYKRERDADEFSVVLGVPGVGTCLTVNGIDNVYVGTQKSGLLALTGKRYHWSELFEEYTGILSNFVTSLSFDSTGYIWVGTDKGLCVYDGKDHWLTANEVPAIPQGRINGMVFGADGSRWFATDTGLVLLKDGALKYYGYKRWVPSPHVRAVALCKDGTVCAATAEGLSLIEVRLMTLADKATYYQEIVEKYNVRKDGFIAVRCLETEGDIASGYVEITDNDGTWTAFYMACQVYRYGVTGEKEALENARRCLRAILKLANVTEISGFTARAIRYPGEDSFGDGDMEWHLSADGECEWKGETSSDEMVGNFYGYSVYYDIAANDEEKAEIAETARKTADHIIEHGYHLVDFDGLPTTWANWSPADLNHNHRWVFEKGQNALEILSILKITYHITGDEKYNAAYRSLIVDHHYLMNVMHYKIEDTHAIHIDDELAFMIIMPLLRYEQDPITRSYLLMGLTRHWQFERIERTPMWSVIYGALTGKHCDIEVAAESLELLPLDLIHWPVYNSFRKDLVWELAPEHSCLPPQLREPLPFDEKPLSKYDANPFMADSGCSGLFNNSDERDVHLAHPMNPAWDGANGKRLEDATVYLHPYWIARYFGLIGD